VRRLDAGGTAQEEIVLVGHRPSDSLDAPANTGAGLPNGTERILLVPMITEGVLDERYLGAAGTERARAHRASAMRELPGEAFRLGRGEPAIPTVYRNHGTTPTPADVRA
jgi:nicotinate phosphoribosyltransferase